MLKNLGSFFLYIHSLQKTFSFKNQILDCKPNKEKEATDSSFALVRALVIYVSALVRNTQEIREYLEWMKFDSQEGSVTLKSSNESKTLV